MFSLTTAIKGLFQREFANDGVRSARARGARRRLGVECLEERALLSGSGSLDLTFDSDGKVSTDFGLAADEGRAVAVQGDGKIVVAGSKSAVTGGDCCGQPTSDFAIARYNANGSLDTISICYLAMPGPWT